MTKEFIMTGSNAAYVYDAAGWAYSRPTAHDLTFTFQFFVPSLSSVAR